MRYIAKCCWEFCARRKNRIANKREKRKRKITNRNTSMLPPDILPDSGYRNHRKWTKRALSTVFFFFFLWPLSPVFYEKNCLLGCFLKVLKKITQNNTKNRKNRSRRSNRISGQSSPELWHTRGWNISRENFIESIVALARREKKKWTKRRKWASFENLIFGVKSRNKKKIYIYICISLYIYICLRREDTRLESESARVLWKVSSRCGVRFWPKKKSAQAKQFFCREIIAWIIRVKKRLLTTITSLVKSAAFNDSKIRNNNNKIKNQIQAGKKYDNEPIVMLRRLLNVKCAIASRLSRW